MRRFLTPRWIVAHLVVFLVVVVCVNLGLWQLRRLEERRLQNAVQAARLADAPAPLDVMLAAAGNDVDTLEYRQATAEGIFDVSHEVLVRSQTLNGRPGYHVVTPLVQDDGSAVLVNRGWVPLSAEEPPVEEAPPPAGRVTVTGVVAASQEARGVGPRDPVSGYLAVVSRVDIDRLSRQLPYPLAPVYLELQQPSPVGEYPVPLPLPDVDDEGPHLSYALQWFGFALVGVVGYAALLRSNLRQRRSLPITVAGERS